MTDPIDHRIIRLEGRVDAHERAIEDIIKKHDNMSDNLQGIQDNLKQIKWIAMGASAAFAVNFFGLKEAVKAFVL